MLDAATGAAVSGLLKLTHEDETLVRSPGLLLNDDGRVYMAISNIKYWERPNGEYEQKMRIASWDSLTNTIEYDFETDFYG